MRVDTHVFHELCVCNVDFAESRLYLRRRTRRRNRLQRTQSAKLCQIPCSFCQRDARHYWLPAADGRHTDSLSHCVFADLDSRGTPVRVQGEAESVSASKKWGCRQQAESSHPLSLGLEQHLGRNLLSLES